MVKIKVQKDDNNTYRFVMKGHCGFASIGKDIICAGCSALCLALAQTVRDSEDKLKEKPEIKINNGRAYIKFTPKDEYIKGFETSIYTIIEGFRVLEYEYGKYVKIIS